jgi:ABC-2 type transport system permease protein
VTDVVSQAAPASGTPLPPMTNPAPTAGLLEVFRRRYLLRLLVRREISARYSGSFLGLLWSYINPLSQFCIYFFIMGTIFQLHKTIPNFAIHIFAAIIIAHFFSETFNAGTRSIVRNKAIVRKMAVPLEMFPVASMAVSLYHVGPQMIILVVACLFSGWAPEPVGVLAVLLALAIIMVLGTGMALVFSAANVFFRDVGSVVNILTNLIRFSVPMIYSYEMVQTRFPDWLAPYFVWNPVADAVMLFQRAFWIDTIDPADLAEIEPGVTMGDLLPGNLIELGFLALGGSIVFLVLAQFIFRRFEPRIPERI